MDNRREIILREKINRKCRITSFVQDLIFDVIEFERLAYEEYDQSHFLFVVG